ncbi:MAG: PilZ domain-containing protein [Planctomycetaceae bacterium]|nr:PilZ domain-containing protein [Planctomycetota bacterium]NUN51432.1 PilZ domain-containing protein [Planctomycetaceae bacterium]
MATNRRKFPRIHSLNFVAEEGRMFRTLDVSPEGMLLEMGAPPPLGSRLDLQVAFGEEIVRLPGMVVRHELLPSGRVGVGVRFEALDARARGAIAAHVEARKDAKR